MTTKLEICSGDHNLLDYCTFGQEAANDVQNVRVDTTGGKDQEQQNDTVISQRI